MAFETIEKTNKNKKNLVDSTQVQSSTHGLEGRVYRDKKNGIESQFYSEKEAGINVESQVLKNDKENYVLVHDIMHPLVQARLESLGLEKTRVTSMENEFIVMGVSLNLDKFRNNFGSNKPITEIGRTVIDGVLGDSIADYNQNKPKYQRLQMVIMKLIIQSNEIGKKLFANSSFGDWARDTYDSFEENTHNLELDEGESVRDYDLVTGFEFDPELFKLVEKDINRLNHSIRDMISIKQELGIAA